MAATFKPVDAFDFAKKYIKNMPLEAVQVRVLDSVLKIMWMAAPWRWTIGSFPAVTLVSNTQDYAVSVPADFLYLQDAYIADGVTVPRSLHVEPTLPTSVGVKGQTSKVALVGANLRLFPSPGTVPATSTQSLISLYKKIAPMITASSVHTAGVQVFDDEWFWVYEEGVLWKSMVYADDQRAGSVTFADGKTQYTGQRGAFEAALEIMRQREKLPTFNPRGPEQEARK